MTTFVYKAKKSTAETVIGQISADSQQEAIDLIHDLGLLPVTVSLEQKQDGRLDQVRSKKVNTKELYVFSRQLANLLKSGVPILRALVIIEEQTHQPYLKSIISQVSHEIKNGRSFSDAIKHYPNVFSQLFVTMIHAGEESGRLQEMLISIAHYLQRQQEIISRVRMALAYPIFMACLGLTTVYVILSFVIPRMAGLFQNLGDALPWPTVILFNISHVLNKGWWLVLIITIASVVLLNRWRQSAHGRVTLSHFILKLPLFGDIIVKTEFARFCRTLDLLLKSGVPIIKSLQTTIPLLSNELIKKDLTNCCAKLTSGGSFGTSLRYSTAIPPMIGHLIAIGEESGNLNDVLSEIAQTYEMETDESVKMITTLLEPVMILVIGLVIGFIVFAILLPIFQIDILAH